MFGEFGYNSGSYAYKTFSNLPPHYDISVNLEFVEIRSVDGGEIF